MFSSCHQGESDISWPDPSPILFLFSKTFVYLFDLFIEQFWSVTLSTKHSYFSPFSVGMMNDTVLSWSYNRLPILFWNCIKCSDYIYVCIFKYQSVDAVKIKRQPFGCRISIPKLRKCSCFQSSFMDTISSLILDIARDLRGVHFLDCVKLLDISNSGS